MTSVIMYAGVYQVSYGPVLLCRLGCTRCLMDQCYYVGWGVPGVLWTSVIM